MYSASLFPFLSSIQFKHSHINCVYTRAMSNWIEKAKHIDGLRPNIFNLHRGDFPSSLMIEQSCWKSTKQIGGQHGTGVCVRVSVCLFFSVSRIHSWNNLVLAVYTRKMLCCNLMNLTMFADCVTVQSLCGLWFHWLPEFWHIRQDVEM